MWCHTRRSVVSKSATSHVGLLQLVSILHSTFLGTWDQTRQKIQITSQLFFLALRFRGMFWDLAISLPARILGQQFQDRDVFRVWVVGGWFPTSMGVILPEICQNMILLGDSLAKRITQGQLEFTNSLLEYIFCFRFLTERISTVFCVH